MEKKNTLRILSLTIPLLFLLSQNQLFATFELPKAITVEHTANGKTKTINCNLIFIGEEHKDKSHDHPVYKYKCIGFDVCKNREKCTKSKTGREITVSTFDTELKDIEKNTLEKNHIYKKRGCIVEHPFGTIKRHFGYDHFLRRGFASVQSEIGLILLAYNLKRAIKVLGVKEMIGLLRA